MKSAPSFLGFFARASVGFLVLMLLWSQVSSWTSYPAGAITKAVLDTGANYWLEETRNTPGKLQSRLRFKRRMPDGSLSTGMPTVEPAHYGYGFPLFLSLLFAARSRNFVRRAAAGYCALLVPQAISLVLVILAQVVKEVPIELLQISLFQADAILLGYMLGILILPTLAPIALWLWLDRSILQGVDGLFPQTAEVTSEFGQQQLGGTSNPINNIEQ